MPPIFKDGSPLMATSGPAYSTDCCCKFIYKKCSDDSIFGYSDTDLGDYLWHIDSSLYIKIYQDGESTNPDDMTGCAIETAKASCAALNFSDLDFGFDVASSAEALCWITGGATPSWNGTDATFTGEATIRYDVIMSTLGSNDFRMEIDFTGFGGFNSGMPAGAGKDGSVTMSFRFDNGTDERFAVTYDIVGSNWEGKTSKSGAGAGNGTTVHETIGAGVPSTPFTFFIDRSGTTLEIGNEGNWSTVYSVVAGSPVLGNADTNLTVRDQSTGFGLNVTLDEMRFTP